MHPSPASYFKDGNKLVHYILIYKRSSMNDEKLQKLEMFIDNLIKCGFNVEREDFSVSSKLVFVKIHAPDDSVLKYAQFLDIDLACTRNHWRPIPKKNDKIRGTPLTNVDMMDAILDRIGNANVLLDEKPKTVSSAERILVLHKTMEKIIFGDKASDYGIDKLNELGVLVDYYPLHDGPYEWTDSGPLTDRQLLGKYWGRIALWRKIQPLTMIEKYFGSEYGFYFAWFGFYAEMLMPIGILSALSALYGVFTVTSTLNSRSNEICNSDILICPKCHYRGCKYEKLDNSCLQSYLLYMCDNPATIAFSIILSFWSTIYLELWQRQEAVLRLQWNLQFVEQDISMRNAYVEHAKFERYSSLKDAYEPYIKPRQRCANFTVTTAIILLLLIAVILAVVGVMVYRITVIFIMIRDVDHLIIKENISIIASVTGSCMSTGFIYIFQMVYEKLSLWLTDLEYHRTQSDYDNSFIFKHFALAFTNNYAPVIYIAFLKGRFYTHPGDMKNWNTFGGITTDHCDASGCLVDLSIQLITIMLTKIFVSNIVQLVKPLAKSFIQKVRYKIKDKSTLPLYEKEFLLDKVDRFFLVDEYTDLVIQYGFVIFFVAGFPLAPLLALINNIIEIRVDARKLITSFRRPVPQRVAGIGAWLNILQAVTYLGVLTNALVIAFCSEFVSELLLEQTHGTQYGFVDSSLSKFDTKDFEIVPRKGGNYTVCYYTGIRHPPNHPNKYQKTDYYWYVLSLRFALALIFEHVILFLKGIIAYAIPDIPDEVQVELAIQERKDRETRINMLSGADWKKK